MYTVFFYFILFYLYLKKKAACATRPYKERYTSVPFYGCIKKTKPLSHTTCNDEMYTVDKISP